MRATGKPHTLWLAFAKMYEGRGLLDSAQEVFRRATQANFKSADDLAAVRCERAEMELRHSNHEVAIELLRQATSEPSVEVRTRIAADARGEPAQIKLHRSAKLWRFYADLTEAHRGVESACAVHERSHDLGLATPLLVLNHAALLQGHKRFEDAFRVYQRGVASLKHPHAEPIWAAYLAAFVQRYGKSKPERVRDLFEDAVQQAPPRAKKAVFLRYAKFEEEFGLATRAMKVYEDAADAVPGCDKLGVYDVYVARTATLFGVLKAREVYHRAIAGGGLPDDDARATCVRFADLEIGLGEIHGARALYVYASGFGDPGAHPEFWRRWNEFEVAHGDESTFREMLRRKRTMTMTMVGHIGVQARSETGTLKRPCAGQQVEDCGTLCCRQSARECVSVSHLIAFLLFATNNLKEFQCTFLFLLCTKVMYVYNFLLK
jgi:pre-mRNA-splicing factor SYF1